MGNVFAFKKYNVVTNLAKNILLNKYKNTPIAGLNEATEIFFDQNFSSAYAKFNKNNFWNT